MIFNFDPTYAKSSSNNDKLSKGSTRSIPISNMISCVLISFLFWCSFTQCARVDKPDFDRHADISVNGLRYHHELSKEYHLSEGKNFVDQQAQKKMKLNKNLAKNTIFFLGDGMSIPTLAAARVYIGGEEKSLHFEEFPFTAMSKTYCVNRQVADSACSATAYLSGVKANYGTIGVNAKVSRGHCTAMNDKLTHTKSIVQWAADAGKSIGLVTTTRVTHATPASAYAHISERDWECDSDVKSSNCDDNLIDDIAEQLVYGPTGSQLKVIFGGGRQKFIDQTEKDEQGFPGERTDRKNLIREWLANGKSGENRSYVWNKKDMLAIKPNANGSFLGLFGPSHCEFNYKVDGISDTIPTLSEMTMKAIEILKTNPKGFFLFVEGGRIDQALHDTKAHIALDETAEFSRAVNLATNMMDFNDTLFLVTADHSHTITLSGYADRGSSIFGVGGRSGDDSTPYMKLNFANGLGYYVHKKKETFGRVDPIGNLDVYDFDYESPATIPRKSESHGGEDVAIFAAGPYSHLFTGSVEQNVIPHFLAFASCIGDGLTACNIKAT